MAASAAHCSFRIDGTSKEFKFEFPFYLIYLSKALNTASQTKTFLSGLYINTSPNWAEEEFILILQTQVQWNHVHEIRLMETEVVTNKLKDRFHFFTCTSNTQHYFWV